MIVNMTDDRQAWLEARSRKMGYSKGRVSFRTCGVCGSAQWSCTSTADSDGTPYEDLKVSEWVEAGPHNCSACMTVAMRNPEIFHWVLSVIDWSHTKSVPPPTTPTAETRADGGGA